MSSPDVFRSSPLRGSRSQQRSMHAEHESSSPGLPSVQDILSQRPSRPPIRSGSQAKPVPDDAPSAFTSAREHWKSVQAAADQDDSVVLIDDLGEHVQPTLKPQTKNKLAAQKGKAKASVLREQSNSEAESWKKYKSSSQKTQASKESPGENAESGMAQTRQAATSKATKSTGTMSKHFSSLQKPTQEEPNKVDPNQPLELEQAMDRRADWTPPGCKQGQTFDISSSATEDAKGAVFKTLLETYGCSGPPQRDVVPVTDEDSGFMKKRKLLELVSPIRGSRSVSPEKSPTKQKVPKPKKKPRTITALATAAYRQATQEEDAEPPGSLREYFPHGPTEQKKAEGKDETKSKPKARKKPAKPKKKAAPPKPVLLSPTTALREVSKQDFVFGTSSQLVREESPTMLRDLQVAIKNSTRADADVFNDSFNSDDIEPSELRRKLWQAGARDDDGQLFHAAVVNLVSSSPEALSKADADPLGYCKHDSAPEAMESEPSAEGNSFETLSDILPVPAPERNTSRHAPDSSSLHEGADAQLVADASFDNLSDILPSTNKGLVITADDDSPFSSSHISVSSDLQRRRDVALAGLKKAEEPQTSAAPMGTDPSSNPSHNHLDQPKFDLYTDAQLTREVTAYGFKPIKRRTAMISLLQQCWQSKHSSAPAGARCLTTSASPTKQGPESSPKRSRGRPRRDSINAAENQESPPSGQALESPKRPRGRPRKGSASSRLGGASQVGAPLPSGQNPQSPKRPRGRPRKDSLSPARKSPVRPTNKGTKASQTAESAKSASATATASLKSPRRKPKASTIPIEIPDSASDQDSVTSGSSKGSPSPTFSPSQDMDLSVSMEDDAEQSLLLDPDEEEAALFKRIANAVTTAPRSNDPMNPSWYEKMLMYDPIVLEDLTAWLNSGHLTRVGYDGEVKPGDVKKWCESESICCLWRVNLRGKERKRF